MFCSVGKTAADKVNKLAEVNNFRITTALPPSRHQSLDLFDFRTITPDEVVTITPDEGIILNSPSNKAPGADRINIQFIKDPIGVILGPGTDIYHLLTETEGNSVFCGPETVDVSRGEAEGNIDGRGSTKHTKK